MIQFFIILFTLGALLPATHALSPMKPDFRLDTNEQAPAKTSVDYRYFSEPAKGLTALIDVSVLDVDVLTFEKLKRYAIAPPLPSFKALFLHVRPKDGRATFFNVIMHAKSGTSGSDQRIRDAQANTVKQILEALQALPQYKKTTLSIIQADTNISSHIPKDNKNIHLAYLSNPKNFITNKKGLMHLIQTLTPRGYALTHLATASRIGIKHRANDMASNQQGTKRNAIDAATKGMTFVFEKATGKEPTVESIIQAIPPHTQVANEFGKDLKDSDHNVVKPVKINGITMVTQPLINVFGKKGFQDETDFYKKTSYTLGEKKSIRLMKEQMTRDHLFLIMQALKQKGVSDAFLTPEALQEGVLNFSDYAFFILKYEWILIQDTKLLYQIVSKFSQLPSFKACNALYRVDKQVYTIPKKDIHSVIDTLTHKNYRITLDKTLSTTCSIPEKEESITVKPLGEDILYAVKNYQSNKTLFGSLPREGALLKESELSLETEQTLRSKIAHAVNQTYLANKKGRQVMTLRAQLDNTLSEYLGWQLKGGFPEDIPQWNPRAEQAKTSIRAVQLQGADIIVRTEDSSQKHLDAQNPFEKQDALLRDAQQYVTAWKAEMNHLCTQLNHAKLSYQQQKKKPLI